jgi:hypothetical protein
VRLRCPAHNQLEADRTYGAGFMRGKREAARAAAVARRAEARRAQSDAARACEAAAAPAGTDVIPWLRGLGFRMDEARRGAAICAHLAHAPLEQRLKCALASLAPPHSRTRPASTPS